MPYVIIHFSIATHSFWYGTRNCSSSGGAINVSERIEMPIEKITKE